MATKTANIRGTAAVWLSVASAFGVLGTWIGMLAAAVSVGDIRAGRGDLSDGLTLAFYVALMACPLGGWAAFWFRRYRLAMLVASPPILLGFASTVIAQIR